MHVFASDTAEQWLEGGKKGSGQPRKAAERWSELKVCDTSVTRIDAGRLAAPLAVAAAGRALTSGIAQPALPQRSGNRVLVGSIAQLTALHTQALARLGQAPLGEPAPCDVGQLLKATSWADAANAVALGWCKSVANGAARVLARHRLPGAEDECKGGED